MFWYAVCRNQEDNDWGYGSNDIIVAKAMAQNMQRNGNPDAVIVVVDDGDDSIAINEYQNFVLDDEDIREVAERLVDGNWDPEDRDIIQSEFYFSDEDMDRILASMAEIS